MAELTFRPAEVKFGPTDVTSAELKFGPTGVSLAELKFGPTGVTSAAPCRRAEL
jgi:hypothetical protein